MTRAYRRRAYGRMPYVCMPILTVNTRLSSIVGHFHFLAPLFYRQNIRRIHQQRLSYP
eukprot:COSAG02_NODE_32119_length_522_cov_0.676123_1_plen_57_part_10